MLTSYTPSESFRNEQGFVLVLALILLLMLTLFGVWALQTSDFENRVAGNSQQAERQFNIAEGAANAEAANVGFNRRDWYAISNPKNTEQLLLPNADSDFDPGDDTTNTIAGVNATDAETWPWQNLEGNYAPSQGLAGNVDYRYLVTYLFADTPPLGYDANTFSSYKFRIQGNTARLPTVVETAGRKMGVKVNL